MQAKMKLTLGSRIAYLHEGIVCIVCLKTSIPLPLRRGLQLKREVSIIPRANTVGSQSKMSSEKMSSDTGASWFGGLKKSFVDVPIDVNNNNAIATTEFLEAAESLSTLFGK